jgi:hypothetical protein
LARPVLRIDGRKRPGYARRVIRRAALALAMLAGVAPISEAQRAPLPEPSPPFGRVIYRAAKAASFESLGVTMIACKHRDPLPRTFAVQFFDRAGRPISAFGPPHSAPTPAGKKVVFVTDGKHFATRDDVTNVRLGHLAVGTARVVSNARIVRCIGKARMDGGERLPSYREEIGLVRAGQPLPDLGDIWDRPPSPRRR